LRHQYLVFDDFAQDRAENDIKELIGVVSCNPYIPEMPSVDPELADTLGVKGTQFTSPYVILLSNSADLNSTTQMDNTAVNRRRHVHIHVSWKEPNVNNRKHELGWTHANFELLKSPLPGHNNFAKPPTFSFNELPLIISESVRLFNKRVKSVKETIAVDVNEWKSHQATNMNSQVMLSLMRQPIATHQPQFGIEYWFAGYLAIDLMKTSNILYRYAGATENLWRSGHHWKVIGINIFSSLVTALGAYLLVSSYMSQSGQTSTAAPKSEKHLPQSGTDLTNVIHNNVAFAEILINGERRRYTTIYFLKGTTFMTVEHFFLNPNATGGRYLDGGVLRIYDPRTQGSFTDFELDPTIITRVDQKDLALYTLPFQRYPAFRDITHHFNDTTTTFRNKEVELALVRNYKKVIHTGSISNETAIVTYETTANGKTERVVSADCLEYNIRTQSGDCGVPVVLLSSQPKIIAIHTSSNIQNNHGSALIVSQRLILRALKQHTEPTVHVVQSFEYPYNAGDSLKSAESIGLQGVLAYEGTSQTPTHQPTKTKLRSSPIQGLLQIPTTGPAVLSGTDKRVPKGTDLLVNGINKYADRVGVFPEDVVAAAAASIEEELLAFDSTTPRRILTLDEAINGIPEEPYIDPLNFSTSSGAPFSLDPHLKGKKDKLFHNNNGFRTIENSKLQRLVSHRLELLPQRARPLIPWLDSLKDERRPLAKCVKPRLFVVAPLDYVIVDRMYNLCFTSHFYQSRLSTFSAVGINRGSREWDMLIRNLKAVGTHGFDGDYSKFDGTLSAQLAAYLPRLITKFYGDNHLAERETLLHEIFFCLHQGRDFLYMTNGGNSSGGDMTVVINTYVSEMYLRVIWQLVMPHGFRNLYYYKRFVKTAIYGDDNIVAVDRFFLTYFNATTVSQAFAEYGLVYTSASKTAQDVAFKPIDELSFLKTTSRMWNGLHVPIFEESANLEISNWIRECDDPEQATEDNCNAVLRSAFFEGPEYFNKIRSKVLSVRPSYNLLHFNTLFNEFFLHGYISDPTNDFGFTRNPGDASREDTHHYLF
jgi:hypothetical protein